MLIAPVEILSHFQSKGSFLPDLAKLATKAFSFPVM